MHLLPGPSGGPGAVRNQEGCFAHKRSSKAYARDCTQIPSVNAR
jgi:hypothetical protein